MIPNSNFIKFLREDEWKYVNSNKSNFEKIKEFFDCYKYINCFNDNDYDKNEFLSDSDIDDDE